MPEQLPLVIVLVFGVIVNIGKNPAVAVILAPNGPRLTEDIISQLTELKLVGDLEGDRFANR
eukprot:SAG31_NODE_2054_length_6549_cov_33.997830_4_plen_62_part_00